MSVLPLFYYPTTVVWVDDDALLLQVATEILGKELNIQTFTSPIACLNFFSTYESYLAKVPFLCGQEDSDDYETINHLPVDLDTAVFASFPEQAGRKNEISVIITDYNMPDISGIALCRELKKMPAKKILLTGDADTAQAIAAFNEGIIDCYIRKDSPNLVEEIKSYVSALQKEYLNDQTKSLLSYFEVDKKMPYSDSVFAAFFESWRKENAIQEHFIFDKQGNMQLVDTNGRKSFFILHTDTTLNAFC
jgi:CheY-like chemotaxis protein